MHSRISQALELLFLSLIRATVINRIFDDTYRDWSPERLRTPPSPTTGIGFSFKVLQFTYDSYLLTSLGLEFPPTVYDFALDGSYVSSLHHIPNSSPNFNYNALVLRDNLPNK
ncbi:hypothetical protein H2248_011755 [Termitomyces sp. 'cryptogamus']|nr:hypothetical protein H2248_011755 [Termitomyces sp. 'cryptogamus']